MTLLLIDMSKRLTVKSTYCGAPENLSLVRHQHPDGISEENLHREMELRWKRLTPEQKIPWEIITELTRKLRQNGVTTREANGETQEIPSNPNLTRCQQILAGHTIARLLRVSPYRHMLSVCRLRSTQVYQNLDWGWNEKVYQEALKHELLLAGYQVVSEIPHTIIYQGVELGDGINARTDLLVTERTTGRRLLLELKADMASALGLRRAVQQCRRYLRMKQIPLGLVVNFPDKPGQRVKLITVFP